MQKGDILSVFPNPKPIIGVIHCKGDGDADVLDRAVREIGIYEENGLDGVLVETYFGTYHQVELVLDYLDKRTNRIPYGVNCLNVDAMGFLLAAKYHCDYLQVDTVSGHLKPRDDESLDAFFQWGRSQCPGTYLMGGVRFKYQPVESGRTVEEDLKIGMTRCDAICVTENATGQETSLEKIQSFRDAIGDYPLIVCAGVTPENVGAQLRIADGAVIGSYFKDTYQDTGDVCAEHVRAMMDAVKKLREEGAK